MRSPCVCVNFDSKAVYQSLHRLTIIPPIVGSATLVTRNKSWELPTNCRKTMLELVRISRLNVCHCKGDLEPQTRGNQAMAESAEPRYDSEAISENVRLATIACVSNWFLICQRRNPNPAHQIQLDCTRNCRHRANVCQSPIDPLVSLVAFLGSENSDTLLRDTRVRSPADGFDKCFRGDLAETAHHSPKFLIGLQVPGIIDLQVEASLRDRLHWCGLQGLG